MLLWIVLFLAGFAVYCMYDVKRKRHYWEEKGIPVPKLTPVLGVLPELIKSGQSQFDVKYTKDLGRVFGYFDGPTPVVVTSDPEMIKTVFVKDFSNFNNRRDFDLNGPILGKSLSVLRDQHWKDVRSVLLPTFTSGKLRQMNVLLKESCQKMLETLEKTAQNDEDFKAEELFGRVTLDIIATTFFGTQIDSQSDPDNPFAKHAKAVFTFSLGNPMLIIAFLFPKLIPLCKKLGMQFLPRKHIDFFIQNTEEIIQMRVDSKQIRRDFLQLMLSHLDTNGQIVLNPELLRELASSTEAYHDKDILPDMLAMDGLPENAKPQSERKLSLEEVVAQSVIFFIAGYGTTTSALRFMTYLLAVNPDIQEKLFDEIQQVTQGKQELTYDLLAEMEYLDACVNETLRIYPPVSRTERECSADWEYNGVRYEKGSVIAIPIYAVQHDPEYWPDPETFDPERFHRDNKANIKPYTFLTFGQGPRNCIGMRFAYYDIKFVIATVLRKFRIVKSGRTQVPLQIRDVGFLATKDGVWVKLEKR